MEIGYYSNERREVLNLIPHMPRNVLELGCGEGNFSLLLKQKYSCHTVGIDLCVDAIAKARDKMDDVYASSIEEFDFSTLGMFDLVIANDLLEHLKDPWSIVATIKEHLHDDGYFVASIPNVQHHKVFTQLLKGNWQYKEAGILDRTHLRFFTKKTMIDLFKNAGYTIESITPINVDHVKKRNILQALFKFFIPDMYAVQFTIVAQKK